MCTSTAGCQITVQMWLEVVVSAVANRKAPELLCMYNTTGGADPGRRGSWVKQRPTSVHVVPFQSLCEQELGIHHLSHWEPPWTSSPAAASRACSALESPRASWGDLHRKKMLSAEFSCDLPYPGWLNTLSTISLSHLPYKDRSLQGGGEHLQSLPSSKFASIKT